MVNLAGIGFERGPNRFRAVHVMGAKNVADMIAKADMLMKLGGLGDPRGLAEAMARLVAEPALGERLGAGAKRSVLSTFDADANFERLLACFEGRDAGSPGAGT